MIKVAPIYDNPGEITSLTIAKIILLLIILIVDTPVEN